jgi:sugar O-acyltransferase (sialic acid O-acetyltransferase NeuD family)
VNEPLLLVGASGLARETLETVRMLGSFTPLGFVDDDSSTWGRTVSGLPVLGPIERVGERPSARVLLCPGSGGVRALLARRLRSLGVSDDRYATIIDPTVRVPASCAVGAGSVLLPGVRITTDVRIGRHVVVMPNAVLTHDDVVEDCATLCAGVALGGGVRVGRGAYLGAGALVRERRSIGEYATVGMGAVVVRDVPTGEAWVGNPARRLRRAGQVRTVTDLAQVSR